MAKRSERTLKQLIRDIERGQPTPPSVAYRFSGGRVFLHPKQPYPQLSEYVEPGYWDDDYVD